MDISAAFDQFKAHAISGRYLNLQHIAPLIGKLPEAFRVEVIGHSVKHSPLFHIVAGTGKTKVLMWSQMHGNESTTTKAVFDLLSFLEKGGAEAEKMLSDLTLHIVPMLNPDGAYGYTRENANGVDLNRDFCEATQPETRALLQLYDRIKPDFCFNLHDQRTLYGAGRSGKPATVSFLAPAFDESRNFNAARTKAVSVIVTVTNALQPLIPGQIGRFDDSFNPNCAGDTFQSRGTPTILFEAGHFPEDYARETTRKFVFVSLMTALMSLHENVIVNNRIEDYLNIPQNNLNFLDFVYKNVKINYEGKEKITNFGAQFREELSGDEVAFKAEIADVGFSDAVFGHVTVDAGGAPFRDEKGRVPRLGAPADFYLGDQEFRNGVRAR